MKNVFLKFFAIITIFTSCESSDNDEIVDEVDYCAGLLYESRVYSDEGVFGEFVAEGIVSESDVNYFWEINGEFVENEEVYLNNEDNHVLIYEFEENGSYEVSVFVETPECPNGAVFTQTIEVDQVVVMDYCAGLLYESRVYSDEGVFGEFVAEGIVSESDVNYFWEINGEFVENEEVYSNNEDNHVLIYEFEENGSYEVSVFVETPECPNGAVFTKTIRVTLF